jgi:hypothetical protein
MAGIRKLLFTNKDAKPKRTLLLVDEASVAPIMAWYGAYFAGDRYKVHVDGKRVEKDINGELVGEP